MLQIAADWAMVNEVPFWIVMSTIIGALGIAILLICGIIDSFMWMYRNF